MHRYHSKINSVISGQTLYDFSKFENSCVELPYLNSCSTSHFSGGFGGQNTLCAPRNALDYVFSGRRHLVPTISLSRTTKLDVWRPTACENRKIREFIYRILQTKKITDRYFSVSNLIPRRRPVTSGMYSGYSGCNESDLDSQIRGFQ